MVKGTYVLSYVGFNLLQETLLLPNARQGDDVEAVVRGQGVEEIAHALRHDPFHFQVTRGGVNGLDFVGQDFQSESRCGFI